MAAAAAGAGDVIYYKKGAAQAPFFVSCLMFAGQQERDQFL